MTTYPVELQDVTCIFGREPHTVTALDHVSMHVEPGELLAIMGPSGSGKSTLLNVAGLLQRPNQGTVLIDGINTATMNDKKTAELRRKHIGVVFQRFNLISTLTIGENVALPLELDGANVTKLKGDIEAALAEVGLEDMFDRFPEEISGGQAQRVAIARALIGPGASYWPMNPPAPSTPPPVMMSCASSATASTKAPPASSSPTNHGLPAGQTEPSTFATATSPAGRYTHELHQSSHPPHHLRHQTLFPAFPRSRPPDCYSRGSHHLHGELLRLSRTISIPRPADQFCRVPRQPV